MDIECVILAAGKGSRLGYLTAERPKTLLPLVNHETILDRLLRQTECSLVQSTTIVTGHAAVAVEEHLRNHWSSTPRARAINTLRFGDYERTNNIGSLLAAASRVAGGMLVVNSDLVCNDDLFKLLIDSVKSTPQHSWMMVDTRGRLGEEEMKVSFGPKGRVTAIGKWLNPRSAKGEYIGAMYVNPRDREMLCESASALLARGGDALYYEDALNHAVDVLTLYTIPLQDGRWTEVDTPADYETARELVARQ